MYVLVSLKMSDDVFKRFYESTHESTHESIVVSQANRLAFMMEDILPEAKALYASLSGDTTENAFEIRRQVPEKALLAGFDRRFQKAAEGKDKLGYLSALTIAGRLGLDREHPDWFAEKALIYLDI